MAFFGDMAGMGAAHDVFSGLGGAFKAGDPGHAERNLRDWSMSGYSDMFLPPALRNFANSPDFATGLRNLGALMANPGGINPNISQAIAPWLANQSQDIATNFRGMGQNQAGAAARGGLPVSIKTALDSALNVSQERAQRAARGEAMTQSEALRRQDLSSIMPLLSVINDFVSSGHGQGVQGLADLYNTKHGGSTNNTSAGIGALGSIIGSLAMAGVFASNSRFKDDIEPTSEDDILSAVKNLPVYKWRYKGDTTKHIGPLAEDFADAFGGNPDYIHAIDAIGALMAATQALAKKVDILESRA